ncbi:phage tail protein [Pseudomonas lundensis]|uniref:phage tail protein n=1 Tax=Serratia proteamaculans TaxID=28151 RepID=UPI002982AC8C|nr:phage tail protein [Serratia proteamaculans]MDW5501381.1 phage tail protein [Serratia proteamaculans]MDW5506446.1 phage tail protein [Pseudomonas lundensis]
MLKPEQLRTALTHTLPALQTHPDKLQLSLDNGRVVSTLGASLSFEYQYQLNLTLSDQMAEEDLVMVTVLAWLHSHQPDILANTEKRKNGFAFKRDVSAAGQLELQLQLTERIQVEQRDGALHIIPLAEPPVPENVIRFTQVYLHGELISQFQQP